MQRVFRPIDTCTHDYQVCIGPVCVILSLWVYVSYGVCIPAYADTAVCVM